MQKPRHGVGEVLRVKSTRRHGDVLERFDLAQDEDYAISIEEWACDRCGLLPGPSDLVLFTADPPVPIFKGGMFSGNVVGSAGVRWSPRIPAWPSFGIISSAVIMNCERQPFSRTAECSNFGMRTSISPPILPSIPFSVVSKRYRGSFRLFKRRSALRLPESRSRACDCVRPVFFWETGHERDPEDAAGLARGRNLYSAKGRRCGAHGCCRSACHPRLQARSASRLLRPTAIHLSGQRR
jgi:hypothetical protein